MNRLYFDRASLVREPNQKTRVRRRTGCSVAAMLWLVSSFAHGQTAGVLGSQGFFKDAGGDTVPAALQRGISAAFGHEVKIIAGDAAADDNFGFTVSISGDTAIVGASLNSAVGDRLHEAGKSADAVPEGLTGSDWKSIRKEYERHRHAAVAVDGGFRARNLGQQWLTHFDGRGFMVEPEAADWRWGLELQSYGFPGHQRSVSAPAKMTAQNNRVTYDWDAGLREWFVNDRSGLEHGFTLVSRPPGAGDPQLGTGHWLELRLAVRGGLRAQGHADGLGVSFVNEQGSAVVQYAGLKVWDADNRELPARIDADATGLRLSVDERGARYPLTIDPIAQQAYLKASNTDAFDRFGTSVAVSGDTVVVGAGAEGSNATGVDGNQADNSAGGSGAAYVFVRDGGGVWSQQAYLKASNTDAGDEFGRSVAVSGDTVVVGAIAEDSNATGVNGNQADNSAGTSGAAYVFVRDGSGVWSQQAYLKASNTDGIDLFGISVAASDDTVVVGASFEASNAAGVNGNQADNSAGQSGAAYLFVRDSGGVWSQQVYLKASNTGTGDWFGISVAVSGDTVVVGALFEASNATGINGNQADNSAGGSGAAYVFVRDGASVWSQQAYLKASNTDGGDLFGNSVAVSGDTVVVGTKLEDSNAAGVNGNQADNSAGDSGAAYVFVRDGASVWSQQVYLKASNTDALDQFGFSVAVSGDTVVVGASPEDSNATGVNGNQADNSAVESGAAYVFFTCISATIYVDAGATGDADDGSSWCDAFLALQDGLRAACAGSTIRVANGVYKPDQGGIEIPGSRDASFKLLDGVTVEGGYAGCGAPDPDERDIEVHLTTLSGDIGTIDNAVDNSYHVVTGSGTDATAVLDGFTVTGGNANGSGANEDRGGGMYNDGGSPRIVKCSFDGNTAVLDGGGLYTVGQSNITIDSSRFANNSTGSSGGGLFVKTGSQVELINCIFENNQTASSGGALTTNAAGGSAALIATNCRFDGNMSGSGGAVLTNDGATSTFESCEFIGNTASFDGGALLCESNASMTLTACALIENNATRNGGAVANLPVAMLAATDCIFINNSANEGGDAIYIANSEPTITDCVFVGHESTNCIRLHAMANPTITGCKFLGNSGSQAIFSFDQSTAYIANSIFAGQDIIGNGGAITADNGSVLTVVNCILAGNSATGHGPALRQRGGTFAIANTTIVANSAGGVGGGLWHDDFGGTSTIVNSILWGNTANNGAGSDENAQMEVLFGSATLNYSTIQDGNAADEIVSLPGETTGKNNLDLHPIFVGGPGGTWTDHAVYCAPGDLDIDPDDSTRCASDLRAGLKVGQTRLFDDGANAGQGFTADELAGKFLQPDVNSALQTLIVANTDAAVTVWGDFSAEGIANNEYQINDYRLPSGSPCIDAGDNDAVPVDVTTDLDGNPRFVDDIGVNDTGNSGVLGSPIVDMGAYERQVDSCIPSSPPVAEFIGKDISTKNRFLSFTAGDVGQTQGVKITFVDLPFPFDIWNEAELWVGPSSEVSENGSSVEPLPGFPNFNAATLQCTPFYTDYFALGTVHVFHEGIVPLGSYAIQVVDETCNTGDEASFSDPLALDAAKWGDTLKDLSTDPPGPPDGLNNIVDALGIIQRFASQEGSILKPRADLDPGCLDLAINITDVLAAITGFQGVGYSYQPTADDPCDSICNNPLP